MTKKETINYWIKQHSNAVDKCSELQAENERLKEQLNGINKAIEAIQDPLNNKAIVDTLWMPEMQATTVVDFLCSLLP